MIYDISRMKVYFELSEQLIERMNLLKSSLNLTDEKSEELNDLIKEMDSISKQAGASVKYYLSAEKSRLNLLSSVKLF